MWELYNVTLDETIARSDFLYQMGRLEIEILRERERQYPQNQPFITIRYPLTQRLGGYYVWVETWGWHSDSDEVLFRNAYIGSGPIHDSARIYHVLPGTYLLEFHSTLIGFDLPATVINLIRNYLAARAGATTGFEMLPYGYQPSGKTGTHVDLISIPGIKQPVLSSLAYKWPMSMTTEGLVDFLDEYLITAMEIVEESFVEGVTIKKDKIWSAATIAQVIEDVAEDLGL
jgi:hypothetical protein